MPIHSLSDLEAFVAVARHRSFVRAAAERGVSRSALSHAVRALEERLGVRLLNRTTRSVTPTEAGESLLRRLAPALDSVGEALDAVNGFRDRPIGTLRLNIPRAAALVLAPLLKNFHERCPQVRLDVVTDDGMVDIVSAGFDAGVRFGESLALDMIAVPFGGTQRFSVVASPAYLELRGAPETPRELASHDCIGRRYPSGALYAWEFEKDGNALDVAVRGSMAFDDASLMVAAAEADVGLAFVSEQQAQEGLAAGRLIRVLEDWCPTYAGFFLYYPSRRQLPGPLRAFVDLVMERRAASSGSETTL